MAVKEGEAEVNYRKEVVKMLEKETGLKPQEIDKVIEVPPSLDFGDFAFPCFILSKKLKKAPNMIAEELLKKILPTKNIKKIEIKGPYLNFFINRDLFNKDIIENILKEKDDYGKAAKKKEKIMIEYPGPNTNKPLHLGHLRNMLIGKSVQNILEASGYKVLPVNINNDRGIHICKSMLAYKKWGKNREPNKKSDHFVGDFYVLYTKKEKENPKLEEEAHEMLKKWEAGDKETRAIWKKMNKWALDGFKETYKNFGIRFVKEYNESDHYDGGKKIVTQALKNGIFKKDDNDNIIADLKELGEKVVLRSDGTSVYITQDINLAYLRYNEFDPDTLIYVVASEQNLHFSQLFAILKMLGFKKSSGLYHLNYGMVYLPEGKMKSREGTVVDTDNLIEQMTQMAKKEIEDRHKLSEKELLKRCKDIGFGALIFFILKYDPSKDFVFDPKESISFEGETGPYIQYAHARINSILKKSKGLLTEVDYSLLKTDEEKNIITKLAEYPVVVSQAANNYKPSLVARHILELSQTFNEFYHKSPILKAEGNLRGTRIALILAIKQVLKNGLGLLGIDAPLEM
ncbi:MAG: arginine--tRNA ligase [Nanoarchaeota archaeon]|nr:arginine--tRNA ligase [Nanoarchaeota archaeon]MBU1270296.1 arginine--tRNA ligase [Nanoarchaeota archaeon]MBU1604536.1 arginine--tRNA ligase [Nanoarchaeota archaeon]MBU2442871.1 arginine--tRNA ligase [Nanoarchaeota archaeon]